MIFNDFRDSIPPLRTPRKAKPKVVTTSRYDLKKLYYDARRVMFAKQYPGSPYYDSDFPVITKSNGLTMAIINFLCWSGHNADRTSTQGRMIKVHGQYKRIHSANRKGTSDITATIKGRSVKLEIKIGKDKPSPEQLKEQAREQAAGGVYIFIHSFDEFFDFYLPFIQSI